MSSSSPQSFRFASDFAETEGFEPSKAFTLPPFQGGALDHYATSPYSINLDSRIRGNDTINTVLTELAYHKLEYRKNCNTRPKEFEYQV